MTQPGLFAAGADRAFPSHPRLDRYFPSASAEDARSRLVGCVERGEGPAVLIGAPGAGKTMLLEVLDDTFAKRFAVAHLAATQLCTRRALLQAILFGLGLPHRDHEEGDLRLALVAYLLDADACSHGMLLLVDEAQTLAPRLLEELRILGNLARGGQPLVRMVLAGSAQLEEALASPEMETLNQRIAARCYLSPLSYDELTQYLRAHIAAAGAEPDELFATDAYAAVFDATSGIPRLINQLCDRAIVMAVEAGAARIDRQAVQAAWSDLHQLPAPWHSAPAEAGESSVVEFGGALDGEHVTEDPTPRAPEWNADAALADVAEVAAVDTLEETTTEIDLAETEVAEAPPETPAFAEQETAADPFGEDFHEEETILDRFAGIEGAFHAATPFVTNESDRELSDMVATLSQPIAEELPTDEPRGTEQDDASFEPPETHAAPLIDEPAVHADESVGIAFPTTPEAATLEIDSAPADVEEPVIIDAGPDSGVLVVEDEAEPAPISMVRRQEYRQLFASLRGG